MSTPTPRTDEQINGKPCTRFCVSAGDSLRNALVPSDFARTLERELAAERAIVSRIWVQLGSPTYEQLKGRSIYDLIDEMRAELATEREKSERYRLASLKLDAALAAEQAYISALEDQLDAYGLAMARKQAGMQDKP